VRDYRPQKWEKCPGDPTPVELHMILPKSTTNNLIPFSGYIEVKENVTGDLEFSIESSRCTLDLKKCEKYSNINFRDVCKKFVEKNTFYSGFFTGIKPPLKCPLQPGNYSLVESAIDLNIITFFPLDGFVWVVTFSLVSTESEKKTKKIAMCVNSETKIVKMAKRS
jgi:hypothetical protein